MVSELLCTQIPYKKRLSFSISLIVGLNGNKTRSRARIKIGVAIITVLITINMKLMINNNGPGRKESIFSTRQTKIVHIVPKNDFFCSFILFGKRFLSCAKKQTCTILMQY